MTISEESSPIVPSQPSPRTPASTLLTLVRGTLTRGAPGFCGKTGLVILWGGALLWIGSSLESGELSTGTSWASLKTTLWVWGCLAAGTILFTIILSFICQSIDDILRIAISSSVIGGAFFLMICVISLAGKTSMIAGSDVSIIGVPASVRWTLEGAYWRLRSLGLGLIWLLFGEIELPDIHLSPDPPGSKDSDPLGFFTLENASETISLFQEVFTTAQDLWTILAPSSLGSFPILGSRPPPPRSEPEPEDGAT